MRVRVTRYGHRPPPHSDGWDLDGDSLTDQNYGAFDPDGHPSLEIGDCALALSVVEGIKVIPKRYVCLQLPDGRRLIFKFNDKAPQTSDPTSRFYVSDPDRFDIFLPFKDDPTIPEWGEATLVSP